MEKIFAWISTLHHLIRKQIYKLMKGKRLTYFQEDICFGVKLVGIIMYSKSPNDLNNL